MAYVSTLDLKRAARERAARIRAAKTEWKEHNPSDHGCKYVGFDCWSCGHIDGSEDCDCGHCGKVVQS